MKSSLHLDEFATQPWQPHLRGLRDGLLTAISFAATIFLGILPVSAADFAESAERPLRPNIVFILADDLGYGELGCYGQKIIQTPRLDKMATEGMRFTHFYAGATVCAPSRSVIMTGQHQGHTRVRGNAGAANPPAQALRKEDTTVADVARAAGYRTALIGKWGLGDVGAAEMGLPRKHGFDYFFGYLNQGHAHNHYPDFLWRDETRVPIANEIVKVGERGTGYAVKGNIYADDLFADEAIQFVKENRERPFFLVWSMVVPHANNERGGRLGDGTEVPDHGPYADKDWPNPDKGHAAMITRLDGYVGRMLDELKKLGLDDRTLVIFSSDNGPHNESRHDSKRFNPAGPLSGIKRDLTDGGIRVPFIARWPGRIAANTTSEHVGYFGDLMATFAELAGEKTPANCDSISFLPTLLGRPADQPRHEFLYWEFHERGFSQAVLYQGRWKGIRERVDAPLVLYDQQNDIAELKNVAAERPEIVATIEAYLKMARSESPDWPIKSATRP